MPDLDIRVCSRQDLDLVLDWAAAEGWNPGRHDALPFQVADPAGFLIGRLDGEPIAAAAGVRYSARFGFFGLFITAQEYRGQGYGTRMVDRVLGRLEGATVGLDGVLAQQANYAKAGFTLAYRHLRHGGTAPAGTPDGSLVDVRQVSFSALLACDSQAFPAERPAFLAAWLAQPDSQGLAFLEGPRVVGYGLRRLCRHGHKIGPLFARDRGIAERIFLGLCAGVAGQPIFLDVPEVNAAALALARAHGLQPVFETARMYRGQFPSHFLPHVFGVTSLELG